MAEQQATDQPVFSIEKIYVKDLSLEVPGAPQVYQLREQPKIEVQLNTAAKKVADAHFEVTLTVTVTAKKDDTPIFLVEAGQAAIFQIRNIPGSDMEPVLGIACPNILFPYVRETISDAVNRAGFPPVILAPVNFEALYQQQRAQAEAQSQAGGGQASVQ